MELPKWMIQLTGRIYIASSPLWFQYKPQMHKVKGDEIRQIIDSIHDGDILLRRYDGYLNTFFTPGFWGHAAIYVGSNNVIHAIGEGVVKEDLLDFCRCDSVSILRTKNNNNIEFINNAIVTANELEIARTGYDYKFKSNNGTVYCTELVDVCYNSIFKDDFKIIAGNIILTPDGIRNSFQVDLIVEFKH